MSASEYSKSDPMVTFLGSTGFKNNDEFVPFAVRRQTVVFAWSPWMFVAETVKFCSETSLGGVPESTRLLVSNDIHEGVFATTAPISLALAGLPSSVREV